MKIAEVLKYSIEVLEENNIIDAKQKARRLLAFVLNKDKEYLMIHDSEEIDENLYNVYLKAFERLKNHEPIQYILENQEFMGFNFYVDKNVLIPQPDTENLVEEVINVIEKNNLKYPKILDLCTGSGAIAISLAKLVKKSIVYGSDISSEALKIAENNSVSNQANVLFMKSDMFKNIFKEYKFNVIVSNPPYIETKVIKTLDKDVQNEPILALDGGEDGLKYYREIAENAKKYLEDDGFLALEIGYNQKEKVEKILKENDYRNIYSRKDLAGIIRVIVAQK